MKRYYRSKEDRKLAGVCGGLGELANIDPTLMRLLFILLFVMTGFIPMLVAYLVAWWIVPEDPSVVVTRDPAPPAEPADATVSDTAEDSGKAASGTT